MRIEGSLWSGGVCVFSCGFGVGVRGLVNSTGGQGVWSGVLGRVGSGFGAGPGRVGAGAGRAAMGRWAGRRGGVAGLWATSRAGAGSICVRSGRGGRVRAIAAI